MKSVNVKDVTCKILQEIDAFLELNFEMELFEVIQELDLLETLDFEFPKTLMELFIRKDRLAKDFHNVKSMLDEYNSILKRLSNEQVIR